MTPQPSKTASIRDKVAAKKQGQVINQEEVKPTHDCPAVEKAVSAIEIAETVEDLALLAKGLADLGLNESEQKQINVLYKTKKQALIDAATQLSLEDIAAFEAQEAERFANQ